MNNVKQLRQDVKKYIDRADETTLKMVHAMLEVKEEKDWWDQLPSKVKDEIDDALAELDKGNGIPHKEVLKKYGKWFSR